MRKAAKEMTKEESAVECPNCKTLVRHEAKFCDNCGRPLVPTGTYDQYTVDSWKGLDPVPAGNAPEGAETADGISGSGEGEIVPSEEEFVPSFDAVQDTNPVSRRTTSREMVSRRIWTLVLWSGSPFLFLVVLLAAVARDNFRTSEAQALVPSAAENATGVSEIAPAMALPLEIVTPFLGEEKTAEFETVNDSFERPRGVAIANGNIYVVDPSQGALIVLDSDGRQLAQILDSNRRFVEPVDVSADDEGNVYVLDAGDGGQVSVHGADGEFNRVVPVPNKMADRSRGLDVDGQGRIWLAMTPALAVAAFDTSGQELFRISTDFEGTDLQPIDVAFYSDSSVFVATAGMTSVLRFSLDGELLNLWPLVTANSVDGPHLALDSEGILYVTQPEQGGILQISSNNAEDLEAWVLAGVQPLRKLVGITADGSGGLLVTDSENGSIYRLQVSP